MTTTYDIGNLGHKSSQASDSHAMYIAHIVPNGWQAVLILFV